MGCVWRGRGVRASFGSARPTAPHARTHARTHTRRGEFVRLCHACCGAGPLTSDVKDRMYVLVREEASLVASSPVCPFFSAAMEWVSSTQFSIVTPWRYWFVCPLSPIPVPHPRDHRDISPSSPIRFDPSLGYPLSPLPLTRTPHRKRYARAHSVRFVRSDTGHLRAEPGLQSGALCPCPLSPLRPLRLGSQLVLSFGRQPRPPLRPSLRFPPIHLRPHAHASEGQVQTSYLFIAAVYHRNKTFMIDAVFEYRV